MGREQNRVERFVKERLVPNRLSRVSQQDRLRWGQSAARNKLRPTLNITDVRNNLPNLCTPINSLSTV